MRNICSTLLALALALSFANPAQAQNVTVGVKGGVGFADLGGDFEDLIEASSDLKLGFSGGAFIGADLHQLFRLQLEGQYVQKGASASDAGFEADAKVNYIELLLPLTLLIPVEGAPLAPRIYAGPSLAFELSCDVEGTEAGITVSAACEDPQIDAPTKSTDYGVFFGAGLDIGAGPGVFTLDVLYNLGLNDIADDDPDLVSVKNRNIQILAGYGIRVGM